MVDYKEFVCGLSTLKQGGKEALRMCFNLCDSNGSGNLSKDQIVEVHLNLLFASFCLLYLLLLF